MMYLVCLTVSERQLVWNRSLVLNFIPDKDDLLFYYKTLLDLQVTDVEIKTYEIPESFNSTLINVNDEVPRNFPYNDLETAVDDKDKRQRYYNYIEQLCMMEKNRAELNVFKHDGERRKTNKSTTNGSDNCSSNEPIDPSDISDLYERKSRTVNRCREWVNELLRSLDADYEETPPAEENGLTCVLKEEEHPPIGWIFTPSIEHIRNSRGSRIVVNSEVGKKWESLLGTDLYPDMVVARRLSAETWAFQHETANALIRATIDWYLATQDTKLVDGISPWITAAEREISGLFTVFRRIKVNERLMNDAIPKINDKHGQIIKLMHQVESQLLTSVSEDPSIKPCSAEIFQRYMIVLFRGFNIKKDYYNGNENLNSHTQRWARNQMGFRTDVDPLLPAWSNLWSAATREKKQTSPDRVSLFLRSLASWDPLESVSLTLDQKKNMVTDWVLCYIDNELVVDPDGRELSTVLQARCQDWCLKFLPRSIFGTNFSSMATTPVLSRLGFVSVKKTRGRETMGIRFKTAETPDSVKERANAIGRSKKTGSKTVATTTTVMKQMVSETNTIVNEDGEAAGHVVTHHVVQSISSVDPETLTHVEYEASVTRHEVHLGTL
jgi:hypothetical protein